MITIKVNDTTMEVDNEFNIHNVLQKINSTIEGIAVAVNNEIIPKQNWENEQLSHNDHILIIQATQGG